MCEALFVYIGLAILFVDKLVIICLYRLIQECLIDFRSNDISETF